MAEDKRIKSIKLKNIKSHEATVLDNIPESGLICICGPNSAGKSAVMDVLIDMLKYGFKNKIKVNKYISYGKRDADVLVEFHDRSIVHIHLVRDSVSTSYISISKDDTNASYAVNDPVGKIVFQTFFNIHDEQESLNIHETLVSKILAVNTTPAEAFNILRPVVTDSYTEEALEQMEIEHKVYKDKLKVLNHEANVLKSTLNNKLPDIPKLKALRDRVINLQSDVKSMTTYEVVKHEGVDRISLNKVKKYLDPFSKMKDIQEVEKQLICEDFNEEELTFKLNLLSNMDIRDVARLELIEGKELIIDEIKEYMLKLDLSKISKMDINYKVDEITCTLENMMQASVEVKAGYLIDNINQSENDIQELLSNTCPTCKRSLE